MNLAELTEEMLRLSRLIDRGVEALTALGAELAQAEHDYRKGRAEAYAGRPSGTVDETKAWVDGTTADLRKSRDLADLTRQASLEACRSRRTQLSALQTVANAHRSEADFARTAPREVTP